MNETKTPSLLSRVSVCLSVWKGILHVNEHVKIVLDPDLNASDGGTIECSMFPAEAVPESAGNYDFVLALHPDLAAKDDEDLERVVVHELCHLLLEPIRPDYFDGLPDRTDVRQWETVIERMADTFIRVFDERR